MICSSDLQAATLKYATCLLEYSERLRVSKDEKALDLLSEVQHEKVSMYKVELEDGTDFREGSIFEINFYRVNGAEILMVP